MASLTKEEHKMYDRSRMQKWDYQNGLDYARKIAREEGRKEMLEEAVQAKEKAKQEKEQIAKSMKEDGITFDQIAKYTGFSIAEIEKL